MEQEGIQAEIRFIGPIQKSVNGGYCRLVTFRVLNIEGMNQATTKLVPSYNNYSRWEPLLKKGNIVKGLFWKDKENQLIDADSLVELL